MPVLEGTAELRAFSAVVLLCVVVCSSVLPWAVYQANHLDIGIHVGFLLIIFMAALQTQQRGRETAGKMLLVVFFTSMSGFLGVSMWCLHLFRLRRRKPFQFFLCHHKEGGGAACRLLKLRLKSNLQVKRDVFLDSDNLMDLSILFTMVRDQTTRSWFSARKRFFQALV